ncbi:MAG: T9SS type A sorting domain-containing protein [Bacteroidota bacterium]
MFNSFSQWTQSSGLTGGMVYDIDIKDTLLFVVIPGGDGIYKKGINQSTWENSFTHYGVQQIQILDSAIVADMWGDLYRSFDRGNTWEYAPAWQDIYTLSGMNGNIYISSWMDSVYRSDDYGDSWINILPDVDFNGLPKVWAYNGSVFAAGGHYQDTIVYESFDNGNTWNTLPFSGLPLCDNGLGHVLRFQDQPWAGANGGTFIFTGSEWVSKSEGLSPEIRITELTVINDTLYCASTNGYYFFDGLSWVHINEGLHQGYASGIVGYNGILYCGDVTGPHMKLPDEAWEPIVEGLNFLDVSDLDNINDTICACTDAGLFLSHDKGSSFIQQPIDSIIGCCQIIMTDSLYYILSYQDGFAVSYDKGQNWAMKNEGLPSAYYSRIGLNANNIFLTCGDGLYKCSHGEHIWTLITDTVGNGHYVDITVKNEEILILGGGEVFLSNNSGGSFILVLDSVSSLSYIEENYYAFEENWNTNTYYLNHSEDGINWGRMIIEEAGNSVDVRDNTIILGGIVCYAYNNYLSVSLDYGSTWMDVLDNLTYAYGYSGVNYVKMIDQRTFSSPTHQSLWYRDDLLTSVQQKDPPKDKLHVYPNPASDHIIIEITNKSGGEYQLFIYDLYGRLLQTKNISPNENTFSHPIEKLSAGMYILQLVNEHFSKSIKLIKN